MANPDYIHTEGWDAYGPVGYAPSIATDMAGEWTTAINIFTGTIVAALDGAGFALNLGASGSGSSTGLRKGLAANYARCVGGMRIKPNVGASASAGDGMCFMDGANIQCSVWVNQTGNIVFSRGGPGSAAVLTSAESITLGTSHTIEWDITFHNTTGIVKVWLDGTLTTINNTGVDTCSTANNYCNGHGPYVQGQTGAGVSATYDHCYWWYYTASGGSETPALTNSVIETQFPAADSTTQFTIGQDIIGEGFRISTNAAAPAANSLVLRKLVAGENGTLNSVTIVPNVTNATAKIKPVVYADNAGVPGTLMSTGAEVVATVAGVALNMPLTTPQAVAGGATYWIGYITDTSFSMRLYDDVATGYRAANTYTSGAPGTAPAMTGGQSTWLLWGVMVPSAAHYTQLNSPALLGDLSYNSSSTVNQVENFTFPGLSSTPSAIYSVAVKVAWERSDAGARTADIQTISGAATSTGNQGSGISPATSYTINSTYYFTDPNTGVAWTSGGLGAAIHGIKITA